MLVFVCLIDTYPYFHRIIAGLCIEPSKHIYKRLIENRPKCINIHGGLCSKEGTKKFTDVLSPTGWTGWSGFADTFTDYHKKQIQEKVSTKSWSTETYEVQCHTLESLMRTYHPTGSIDYLSVDTEGSEREIIDSIDFQQVKVEGVVQVEANLAEVLQLGDTNAVLQVQGVRDRLANNDFVGPLTARSGLDEFFVSKKKWQTLKQEVKDLFLHHKSPLPNKQQMEQEKVRQQQRSRATRGPDPRAEKEQRAWMQQHMQYNDLANRQRNHPTQGSNALNADRTARLFEYQRQLEQQEKYYQRQQQERYWLQQQQQQQQQQFQQRYHQQGVQPVIQQLSMQQQQQQQQIQQQQRIPRQNW